MYHGGLRCRAIKMFQCTTVAALLLMAGGVPAWALSFGWSTDTFYTRSSAALDLEQRSKLEVVQCRVGSRAVEVVNIVGHAASDEADAMALSLRRADEVAKWFEHHTTWTTRVEAKGATQPVASNQEAVGRSKNRRVEISPVVANPFEGESHAKDCMPAWMSALFASPQTAISVARSLVLGGELAADVPFFAALNAGRLDIFDALVAYANIPLSKVQRARVAIRALQRDKADYFLNWVEREAGRFLPQDGDLLLRRACNSGANGADTVDAIDALTAAGARVASAETMACIDSYKYKPVAVLDALVRAGGLDYVTADILVASGGNSTLLNRLLALGLKPNASDTMGATLFHTTNLASVGDVQRLLDWGLDVNALAKSKYNDPPVSPMYTALPYASVEVLEYMKQHGARIKGAEPFRQARRNYEAQLWMADNAVPVTADEAIAIARNAPKTLAVFEALRARAVDLNVTSSASENALAVAITLYDVALVKLLVDSGVDLGPLRAWPDKIASSALEMARNLTAEIPPPSCIGPCPKSHPGPIPCDDLEQRKQAIIFILQNALNER